VLGWVCELIAYVTKEIIGMSNGSVIFLATYSWADCDPVTYRHIIRNASTTPGSSPTLVLQAGAPSGEGKVKMDPEFWILLPHSFSRTAAPRLSVPVSSKVKLDPHPFIASLSFCISFLFSVQEISL